MTDPQWVLRQLRESLSTLESSSEQQAAYLRRLGDVDIDELALEFDDIAPAALSMTGSAELSSDQREAVAALDGQLASMSGPEHSDLWTVEALHHAPEWAKVRGLAQKAIDRLDNPTATS